MKNYLLERPLIVMSVFIALNLIIGAWLYSNGSQAMGLMCFMTAAINVVGVIAGQLTLVAIHLIQRRIDLDIIA